MGGYPPPPPPPLNPLCTNRVIHGQPMFSYVQPSPVNHGNNHSWRVSMHGITLWLAMPFLVAHVTVTSAQRHTNALSDYALLHLHGWTAIITPSRQLLGCIISSNYHTYPMQSYDWVHVHCICVLYLTCMLAGACKQSFLQCGNPIRNTVLPPSMNWMYSSVQA